jgi:hypothetical protein
MRMILIVLAALSLQQYSQAQSIDINQAQDDAVQASLDARDNFVTALENKDFTAITHDGFDSAIQEMANEILVDQNDPAMAQALLDLWAQASLTFEATLAARIANKDLGDHDPLFPWLNNFIVNLASKYGNLIYSLQIIKDIQTLNFAIPVVFTPTGAWQSATGDNRIEYRKHFIPFANLVTYYVTLYGCKYELKKHGLDSLKKICSKAADKLEFVMGRYIAPVVSDWIFKASNHALTISDGQRHYNSVGDLRQAIQQ